MDDSFSFATLSKIPLTHVCHESWAHGKLEIEFQNSKNQKQKAENPKDMLDSGPAMNGWLTRRMSNLQPVWKTPTPEILGNDWASNGNSNGNGNGNSVCGSQLDVQLESDLNVCFFFSPPTPTLLFVFYLVFQIFHSPFCFLFSVTLAPVDVRWDLNFGKHKKKQLTLIYRVACFEAKPGTL